MLRHVLVPLDNSPLSEEALEYVTHLLHPDGRLTLLTIIDTHHPAFISATDSVEQLEEALIAGQNYLTRIQDEQSQYYQYVGREIRIGKPAEIIIQVAQNLGVEAIIMSTHGRSGFDRFVFGSVALKVLSATPCPVFIIPSKERQSHIASTEAHITHKK